MRGRAPSNGSPTGAASGPIEAARTGTHHHTAPERAVGHEGVGPPAAPRLEPKSAADPSCIQAKIFYDQGIPRIAYRTKGDPGVEWRVNPGQVRWMPIVGGGTEREAIWSIRAVPGIREPIRAWGGWPTNFQGKDSISSASIGTRPGNQETTSRRVIVRDHGIRAGDAGPALVEEDCRNPSKPRRRQGRRPREITRANDKNRGRNGEETRPHTTTPSAQGAARFAGSASNAAVTDRVGQHQPGGRAKAKHSATLLP